MKGIILFFLCGLLTFSCSKSKSEKIDQRYLDSISQSSKSNKEKTALNTEAFRILISTDTIKDGAILFSLARNFYNLGRYDKFREVLDATYPKLVESNDSIRIGHFHKFSGEYFLKIGVPDSAFYHFNKAIKIYSGRSYLKYLPECYFAICGLQLDISDNLNAQSSAIKCYEYARKTQNEEYQPLALMMMGIVSYELGDYSKALSDDFNALEILNSSSNQSLNKETCIGNIGGVYQTLNQHEKAIYYFKMVLRNKRVCAEMPELYAMTITNMAISRMAMKQYKDVEKDLLFALKIREKNDLTDDMVTSYNKLSEYRALMKDTLAAIQFNALAIDVARISVNPRGMLRALDQGLKVNSRRASKFAQEYIRLSDSMQLENQKNQNKFARIAFETDEITTQKDKAVKQKWIVLIVGSTLFLLGVLLFIIKMQRAKQKELILIHEQQKSDESIYQLIQDQQIKIDEGRQAEKKRISLELHDGVMNKLTSTRLNLYILNKKQDDETIKRCLTFIDDIQNIEKEIRKVAHDLSDDLFSGNKGFNLVLQSLFDQQAAMSSTAIHPEIDPAINWEIIDNSVKMNLYRILQEILNNCNKYAKARNIFITMSKESDGVFTHTHDDGKGFDLNTTKKGIGLRNITQRVQTLNGKLTLYSQPNEGTTISFFLPTVKSAVNP